MSHYVVKIYGIVCDGSGCDASIETLPLIDARNKLAEARRQVALPPDAWTYRDGKDLCRTCSATTKQEAGSP